MMAADPRGIANKPQRRVRGLAHRRWGLRQIHAATK